MEYLRQLGDYCQSQPESDATLVAWTSEGQAAADKANEEWQLTKSYGYSLVIGDDSGNGLPDYLRDNSILPYITTVPRPGYPHGMVLPAQVWYAHHGNPVIEWCQTEDPPERPQPEALWKEAHKRKHALNLGSAVAPSHYLPMLYAEEKLAAETMS